MEYERTFNNETISNHKDLKVWILAVSLAADIYQFTSQLPAEERYGICHQLRGAAVSIASNIAEGAARGSRKEFIRFLYIASGSASELDTQLIILKMAVFVDGKCLPEIEHKLETVRKMIHGLIKSLRS